MKFNTLKYFFVDALKSLKRNYTLSIAAMITVLITFFIFGTFILIGLNFNKAMEDVASKLEIKVYLDNDIKLIDQREIELKLNELDGVKEVIYESKEEAFINLKDMLKDNQGLLEGYDLEDNPLPSSFIVKLEDPEFATAIGDAVRDMAGVEDISNQQEMIDTISSFVDGIKIAGLILFVVFIGVSIFLITNTTKITVYSRRKEVGIMKYVGATDWFIRWPFIIEGMIIGIIGSLLSTLLLYLLYRWIFGYIISNVFLVTLVLPGFVLGTLTWIFVLGGTVIGAFGSILALRKFLDV